MQRLLVSVRGPNESLAAAKGGAHIIDVEYPGTALGTPYPLNIKAVRECFPEKKVYPAVFPEEEFAACAAHTGSGRFGNVSARLVTQLGETMQQS